MIKDGIIGSGSFQVTVQLMNGSMPLPYNYSLSPEEAVVVEVSLNTSSDQIKVVITKCWATPTQNPVDTISYIFIEHRSAFLHFSHSHNYIILFIPLPLSLTPGVRVMVRTSVNCLHIVSPVFKLNFVGLV